MAAFTAKTLPRNEALIPHLDLCLHSLRFPKFLCKSTSLPINCRSRQRIALSASATKVASDLEVGENSSESITKWGEFARHASGEWDGYGAEFSSEGKPIELPEAVVPEAYREWEVQVFDWQTQCPTLAEAKENVLVYKLIKLLPTVGCEADAATRHSIDERNIGGIHNNVSAFAYHPNGCYVAVWPIEDCGAYRILELEHCLVDPRNREARVRVIQVVRVEKTELKLQNVKVFCEQWYGPFRNGEQLGGCAIRESGFASTDATKDSEVVGVWKGQNVLASFKNPQMTIFQELVDDKPQKLIRDKKGLVLLPKQLWCSLKEREDAETWGEVGWLVDRGHAMTSRCVFLKDGMLKIWVSLQKTNKEQI
eukprot:TRINITY_DN424_c0_g1_i2.p1 TRINITY_DN424_c0_g1~~TRINITY_DN424_c0_g1_i2.p1  ORF type:complete len:367 (-),score=56.20 TRINITY_DN424_c0_g1_i2:41-1141(-)